MHENQFRQSLWPSRPCIQIILHSLGAGHEHQETERVENFIRTFVSGLIERPYFVRAIAHGVFHDLEGLV